MLNNPDEAMDNARDETAENYGRLYGFLLDVAKCYVDKFHETNDMGKTGEEIYDYIEKHLSDLYNHDFRTILTICLSERQLKSFDHVNRRIAEEELDLSFHFKIMNLLRDRAINDLTKFVVDKRNKLCHLSMKTLRLGFSQEAFQIEFGMMFLHLANNGVDREILKTCAGNMKMNLNWELTAKSFQ